MKILLAIVMALHGLVHALGFVQGMRLAHVAQLPAIGLAAGVLWLTAALLLLAGAVLLLLGHAQWWIAAAAGVLLSQALILSVWSEAHFGTIANAIILVGMVLLLRARAAS